MKILAIDIETGSAEDLHRHGAGYIRLCGWADVDTPDDVTISVDPAKLVKAMREANAITAHNGINFDLLALAVHGFISFDEYERLCLKLCDTLITTRHLDPVAAKGAQPADYYRLGETAERYGLDGKDTVDFAGKMRIVRRVAGDKVADRLIKARVRAAEKADYDTAPYGLATTDEEVMEALTGYRPEDRYGVLKILMDLYGGYDKIPQDDPDYCHYLTKDVKAQCGLFKTLHQLMRQQSDASRRYERREHYVATAMGRVTLEGFRTDVDLTMRRWAEGQARLDAAKQMMHERHGMPLDGKKPHTTNAGKAAFKAALMACNISERALAANWPLNKDGSLSTAKDVLNGMVSVFERTRPEAAELCRTILAMNGERTVYGTVLAHLVGDRVHPYIGPDQASGRWSMKNPGLTVLGKRGGKARERAMLVADEGDVLVAIDADQIDARMIAAMSQDPEYMKLFAPGMDLHSEVAFRVWPDMAKHGAGCHRVALEGCDCGYEAKCHCELRDRAKVFGHGWNYGMQWKTMAAQHGVDPEVAKGFCDGMAEAFPVLVRWQSETREAAGVLGYGEEAPSNDSYRVLHTLFGRPVRVERNRAYTQACAQLGQGSTRDGMAEAILKLPPTTRRRIRAVIHDEIILSIPAGKDAQARAQAIADGMAYEVAGVTISFGCSRVARTWAGCYGEQYEVAA